MSVFSFKADVSGMIFKMDVKAKSQEMTDKTLQRIGNAMVLKMAEFTSPHDWNGDLTDSLSWTMSNGMTSNSKYQLVVPPIENSIDIGSALPYAWFREYGAGKHVNAEGSEEFQARLLDWYDEKVAPSVGPDDYESVFRVILFNIRDHQDAVPFAEPALNLYGENIAMGSAVIEMKRMWSL
jgi:hypothetical protein